MITSVECSVNRTKYFIVVIFLLIVETSVTTPLFSINSSLPFVFSSDSLPDDLRFMPAIGNGHLGFTILNDAVFLNGIYNGKGGLSHRARIPNYSNIKIVADSSYRITYSLNVQQGIFQINMENSEMKIIQLIYAHRFHNRAIINQVYIYRLQPKGALRINIRQEPGQRSDDIDFSEPTTIPVSVAGTIEANDRNRVPNRDNETIDMIQGYTKELEDVQYQKLKRHVCVMWNHVPEVITLAENEESASFRFVMTADDLCNVAKQEMMDVLGHSSKNLLRTHRSQWIQFWNDFSITVANNLKLAKTIYGSLFYLASSLPSFETNLPLNPFFGLSPTGLGRGNQLNDYIGHSFWDTEIWMLPVVSQMDPRWTRELLSYRFRVLESAKDHAAKVGYDGARFPWESAFTGVEVTQPCCPEVALLQLHITGDIGFAVQNYFATTYDIEWFNKKGCPLAENIAKFWASRVELDETTGLYDIKHIMGPDEDHPNVTNNVFTNVIAKYSLNFGEFAQNRCNKNKLNVELTNFSAIAEKIKILYNSNLNYHPQFDGYEPGIKIKQADTVLLGYPLMFPMNVSTRENDLRIYGEMTRNSGPAMTWAMHSINHLDIGNYLKADEDFERGFESYVRSPFQVWSEVAPGQTGAANFITGAGGFLQSLINGYAGIRIHFGYMEIRRPRVPPNSTKFAVTGIKYLGSRFKISIDDNGAILKCLTVNIDQPLQLFDQSETYDVSTNLLYNITTEKIFIKPKLGLFRFN